MGIYEYTDCYGRVRQTVATSSRALAGCLEGHEVDYDPASIRLVTKEVYTDVEKAKVRSALLKHDINPIIIRYLVGDK